MSAKDGFETSLLQHIFQNTAITLIGDAAGLLPSAAAGSLWVSLYTITPSDSAPGTECDYAGYLRVATTRASGTGGWTVSGNNASNTSAITFPQCVSGTTDTAVAFAINTASSVGGNDAILWGALSSNLDISVGVTPEFAIGDLDVNCD